MASEPAPDPAARLLAVTLDCPEPATLARFYSEALDLPVTVSTPGFVLVGKEGSPGLGFYQADDYRPPTWPDSAVPKQVHLDLGVDDLDAAQARLIALGAIEPDVQPVPHERRVLLDPAGHPFCITL